MNRASNFALFLCLAYPGFAQSSAAGPMGVLVTPPQRLQVPTDIRAAIPPRSTVRLIQPTQLTRDGENIVIYDRGSQYEPHAHIAVIKNHLRVADFSLVKLFAKQEVGDTYALFQAAELNLDANRKGFIAAFRNIGDGAGTLFVLITGNGEQFTVAWLEGASEAQFQVRPGDVFQLWNADEGDDCVWCPHHYEVTNYIWKSEALRKTSSFNTKQTLSPYRFSEKPILLRP